jgi:hypothetical protein
MRRGNSEARATVEKILLFIEALLSSVNTTAKNFETTANTKIKGTSGLAETKTEIKYPMNTVTRTCIIDEKQETNLAQAFDERIVLKHVPSSFFTKQ